MERLTGQKTMLSWIVEQDADTATFDIRLRSDEVIRVTVESPTREEALLGLDLFNRDRVPSASDYNAGDSQNLVRKYNRIGRLIQVEGLYQEFDGKPRFLARRITILNDVEGVEFTERRHSSLTQLNGIGCVGRRFGTLCHAGALDCSPAEATDSLCCLYQQGLSNPQGQHSQRPGLIEPMSSGRPFATPLRPASPA